MEIIPAEYYSTIYVYLMLVICILQSRSLAFCSDDEFQLSDNKSYTSSLVLIWTIALFIGFRPISRYFPDMLGYAANYEAGWYVYDPSGIRREPVFGYIMNICNFFHLPTTVWFAVITLSSMLLQFYACRKWFGNHLYTSLLFLLTGFYFWGTMTVIIRSCLASSIVIFAMSLYLDKSKRSNLYLSILLMVLAFYTHRSSTLLIIGFFASKYLLKKLNWAIYFWLLCLMLSLIVGDYFEVLFSSWGFDDRMTSFTSNTDYSGFSHAGFRWDFLLYSAVPIVFGWYVDRLGTDKIYSILLGTYILCNSFWLLVIRASFSDRFAGLSWILYPIVLAYPLLKMQLWGDSRHRTRIFLIGHVFFIFFMNQIYYSFIK